ncbi:MAG: helix-turn-helix domain-containing protein [Phycisphaeraceae bacterium]|nr:helix-turn-helix domain-containing protein [Phycisphaeraceae bacterium]
MNASKTEPATPLLLREREAANMLGVSPRTLFAWREAEGLPYLKLGRTVRYPLPELQRWAAARVEGGTR